MKRQTFWAIKGHAGSFVRDPETEVIILYKTRREAAERIDEMGYDSEPVKVYVTIQAAP